jgi:hypothetical protein
MKIFLPLMLTASLLVFNGKPATKLTLKPFTYGGAYPTGVFPPNTLVAKSNNGQYTLVYQGDGNLVLYNSSKVGLWDSETLVSNPSSTQFGENGDIYVVSNGATVVDWDANAAQTLQPFLPFFWVLQDDGNIVRYWGTPGHIAPGSTSISTNTENGQRSPHFHTIQ